MEKGSSDLQAPDYRGEVFSVLAAVRVPTTSTTATTATPAPPCGSCGV